MPDSATMNADDQNQRRHAVRTPTEPAEALFLSRKLIGFARAGVLPVEALVASSQRALTALLPDAPLEQSQRLLSYMKGRVLPSVASCTKSMAEIDAILVPMRQQRDLAADDAAAARRRAGAERG
jgi:hypothetical protein